jgi:hypothetical protein
MAVLAQVVGFEQRLARLDGMLHGVQGILFGSLMFARRRSGVLVRPSGNWVGSTGRLAISRDMVETPGKEEGIRGSGFSRELKIENCKLKIANWIKHQSENRHRSVGVSPAQRFSDRPSSPILHLSSEYRAGRGAPLRSILCRY